MCALAREGGLKSVSVRTNTEQHCRRELQSARLRWRCACIARAAVRRHAPHSLSRGAEGEPTPLVRSLRPDDRRLLPLDRLHRPA
eukprot:917798-Pleurochrysis_carterae.AAC.1